MTRLPHQTDRIYLAWVGMETDLIFNRGIELPGFASFPLLEQPDTRALLTDYMTEQIALASAQGCGLILETPTWMANRDRARDLGYDDAQLAAINRDAVGFLDAIRAAHPGTDMLISVNIGPRDDAYAPGTTMTPEEAEAYHALQINSLAGATLDLVSAYTLSNAGEAIGIARAAARQNMPCVISFTVETDGRLPSGQTLDDAIAETDAQTGASPAYYMINCAHPDHFATTLTGNPRIMGVVANASRCSHAELDEATELDDGDPAELGTQIASLVARHPHIRVIGGCCGTDLRHMEQMAQKVGAG